MNQKLNNKPSDGALNTNALAQFQDKYDSNPSNKLIQNVVTQHDVNEIALDRSIVTNATHTFSTVLDDWAVTNQARSGRCWMFAGLNLFRVDSMKALNLNQFEFSQSFVMFWDKIERSNFILEAIIETADRPTDDRTVAWLLETGIEDGGQWDMFVNLIKKHGVVPKTVMPESESSGNSARMNSMINYQIRQGAMNIRELYSQEGEPQEIRELKNGVLNTIYKLSLIHI